MNFDHIDLIYENLYRRQDDEFDLFEKICWLIGYNQGVLKCKMRAMIYRAS